jgi:hypothetical protein
VLTPAGAIIVILLDLKTMATGVITLTLMRGICVRPPSSPRTVAFAKRDSASRKALSVRLKSGLLKMARYAFARLGQTPVGWNVPMASVGSAQRRLVW